MVLRHEMPDGSSHLDWFIDPLDEIEPADTEARRLLSFRVDRSPLGPETGVITATESAPHRVFYLDAEGPVRGGALGSVARIGRAWASVLFRDSGENLVMEIGPAPGQVTHTRWTGHPKAFDAPGPGRQWVWTREQPHG